MLYLAVGPLFAIPRTGSVSFEIGVRPFLPEAVGFLPLLIFTIIFFGMTCYFSMNASKIVDIVGKILTPLLLIFIAILIITAIIYPMGEFQSPTKPYLNHSFFKGFQDGYLTMDTLAAFVFGIIVIQTIKDRGIVSKGNIMITCIKAGLLSATLLAIIYSALTYIGASSVNELGLLDNGATILAGVSSHYFGSYGKILIGFIVLAACLTTSIGLITSSASYFHKLFPKISYKMFSVILSIISAIFANVGLMKLISISEPVLVAIYPLAICLIFLTFFHPMFKGKSEVYIGSLFLTFIISLIDGLKEAGLHIRSLDQLLEGILPFYSVGMGWLIPAIIGGFLGFVLSYIKKIR